jgi:K+-transporting ATPase KdpF subunit
MPRSANGSNAMLDLVLGAIVSGGLMIYLVWALVRPEDF